MSKLFHLKTILLVWKNHRKLGDEKTQTKFQKDLQTEMDKDKQRIVWFSMFSLSTKSLDRSKSNTTNILRKVLGREIRQLLYMLVRWLLGGW